MSYIYDSYVHLNRVDLVQHDRKKNNYRKEKENKRIYEKKQEKRRVGGIKKLLEQLDMLELQNTNTNEMIKQIEQEEYEKYIDACKARIFELENNILSTKSEIIKLKNVLQTNCKHERKYGDKIFYGWKCVHCLQFQDSNILE